MLGWCYVMTFFNVGDKKWHNVGPTLCHFFSDIKSENLKNKKNREKNDTKITDLLSEKSPTLWQPTLSQGANIFLETLTWKKKIKKKDSKLKNSKWRLNSRWRCFCHFKISKMIIFQKNLFCCVVIVVMVVVVVVVGVVVYYVAFVSIWCIELRTFVN
jgi:hypothetical protein